MTLSPDALLKTYQEVLALASSGEPASLEVLRATVAGARDQFVRRAAVEAIGAHPHGRELCDVILQALSGPSEYLVRAACDVIVLWKWHEGHDAVAALLVSPSASTRLSAMRALDAVWRETDMAALFNIYRHDTDPRLRREAAWIMRRHAGAADWRMLFDAFHGDEPPRHRQWACALAAAHSGREVLPVLERLCADRDGHVRVAAARAIEQIAQNH